MANEPKVRDQALLRIAGRVAKLGGWVVSVPALGLTWSDETAVIHDESPGFSPASVEDALRYYPPEYREQIGQAFRACVETGTPFEAELQIVTAKGRPVWVRTIGEAVRNSANEITHVQGAIQDISDHKRAADQIQSLSGRLHETLETISDAFFTLDREWHFTYLNGVAERLLERSRTQLLGQNIWTEFAAAVGTPSDHEYRRAMTERVTVRFEQYYPPLDRWFMVEAHPTREGIAVYFHDVTEARRAAEKELAQMEGRYRALLEAAPDAMVVVNQAGQMIVLSKRVEQMFGYPLEELLGKSIEMLVPERFRARHEGQRATFFVQPRVRAIEADLELSAIRKDATEFPVEISLSPLQSEEGLLVTAAIRDISLRKDAEQRLAEVEHRYRGFLEAAPVAMVLVNPEAEIVLVNAQGERQFGYDRDELVGQNVKLIIPEDSAAWLISDAIESSASARAESSRFGSELKGRHRDGTVFPIEIVLSPLPSAEGLLVTVAIRDISAQKQAEADLLRTVEELNRSNHELEQFAYIASHDLQEPLRMVTSYTQLLSKRYKGKLDSDADEFIAFAVEGANRMQHLIRDLLAYSRVGRRGKSIVATSSQEALDQAVSNLSVAIEDSGALVTRDELPMVMADEGQLVQLFQNLVGNAIKYKRAGVPEVHVSAARTGESWTFSVRDNGLGIASKDFDRVFGMFQRLHGREEFAGTGIGLAICKKIVERHGGKISVESQPGEGSTFRFALAVGATGP